ncbi:FAD-dependent monooxygenase [Cellulomonas xylanilytica]|uniref:FAD-dependent oxidoreductase n=1 Tax=Cellulomonas xylanilytica TaxID=233583 RepID=A0A510V0W4_9CELL|nr:FAD-dependent monooxygenase [Cellulomonas xylanilytica]GEK20532.1 FAD-dependent oxidoreductase [Cellulomonas xylanilytica]
MTLLPREAVHEVIVVGAGPVGLLLAAELAATGARPVVLERSTRPTETPKANGVVGRAAVELRRRGLLRGTRLRVVRPPRYGYGPFTLDLGLLRSPVHVLPVPQRRLEELLERRAVARGATILRGHELTEIEQDDSHVTARASTAGSEVELRARYLVGCDGARSSVRTMLGIAFPGLTDASISRLAQLTIAPDVAVHDRHGIDIRGIGRLALFRPNVTARGSITITPARALDRSAPVDLFHVSTHEPRAGAAPTDELSSDELRASLRRVLGADLPFTAAHAARSTVAHSRQAERYRSGRVLLAGDAAHVFNAGGSALNVGLADAIALAERLALALGSSADLDPLDGYEAERHPAARRAIAVTRVQHALEAADETGDALRALFEVLLRDRAAARRIATLLEG